MEKLNTESITALDRSSMLKLLLDFPGQIRDASLIGGRIDFAKKIKKTFDKIVFSGLGGSAIGADIIRSYILDECGSPAVVNRDYTLPAFVDKNTLLIVSSYSGNTEETMSAYKQGRKAGASIVAVTSGGSLKESADKDGFCCITIPPGLPPRCALGYSSIPVLALLSKLGIISDKSQQIDETADVLARLGKTVLAPGIKEDRNIAKNIANAIFRKYAVIYGANQHIDSVVTRWRGQLAENSKTVSSSHVFPEMNHNEIVGWRNPVNLMKDLVVIMLRDEGDHPRVKIRMDITKSIIAKEGVRIIEVNSEGKGLLSRIFSLIYIGDFVSFYLAILNKVDPTPVDSVTYLKKELARQK